MGGFFSLFFFRGVRELPSVAIMAAQWSPFQMELSFLLCPQEGILQRLQNSVEQEESRWRVKLELSQAELREVWIQV